MEEQNNSLVIKTSDWVITLLLLAIPLVNIIMLFVWAFGSGANPNKANFAKAALIWVLIGIVIYAIVALIFGAALFSAYS
ncbi:MAG: hypothetical protein PF436_05510 [Prolixibacteraceae bacterium]|jgi:Zn-dependent protease with chaperone function|nr:hypothetical protein [Prolixibacteraceae bacterium]